MDEQQRIRLMIGDLMVTNASIMAQIERLQKENEELKAKIPPEKPSKR